MKDIIADGTAIAIVGFAVFLATLPWWGSAIVWLLRTGLGALSSVGQP